ncbi:MAG: Spo0B domain-containing protein [Firmicutes bacterium]|nr:Spo0B domain-containing protein [Bacillota bacterium]
MIQFMENFSSMIPYLLRGLYHETTSAAAALALALILNGYNLKKRWRKFLLITLVAGPASTLFFYFPQPLRIISLVIMYYLVLRFYFRFSPGRTVIAFFSLYFIFITGKLLFSVILTLGFGVTMDLYYEHPLINWLFPLSYNIPIIFLAYLACKRRWHLFSKSEEIKIPPGYALPFVIQTTLLTITVVELLFSFTGQSPMVEETIISLFLIVSTLMSFVFIWQTLKTSAHEAVLTAQEKLAEEMRREIDVLRGQRHDFINHVQIITALLSEGRREELARYVKALRED